jgi:ABC-type polysaccharide/polyol phosphate export permease
VSIAEATSLAGPPKDLRYRREFSVRSSIEEVWQSRPLVRALAERDIRAFYKQAWLGIAWAVVNPVVLMLIFTLIFTRVAKVDTGGAPYVLFSYLALVPWNFFSSSVSSGGVSIINQMALVNKIRCPREVFPLSNLASSAVSAIIATGVLLILFVTNRFVPKIETLWVPIPLLVMITFTIAVTLAVSAVTVFMRDVRHALPLIMQLALFATPIAYSIDFVPTAWQIPYVMVNPMAAVITSYRDCVLYGQAPPWNLLLPAAASSLAMLYGAMRLFRRLEVGFADVA